MRDAKELLRKYGELRRCVDDLKERLKTCVAEKYQTADGFLRIPKYDGIKVQANRASDVVYDTVEKLICYHDERIKKAIGALKNAEGELDIMQAIIDKAGLCEVEREYIEMRYVKGLSPFTVAYSLNYSERRCREIKISLQNKIANTKTLIDK